MSAVHKFLFDLDFEHNPSMLSAKERAKKEAAERAAAPEPEPEEIFVPTFSEADVEEARQAGFAAGREEGVREAASAIERQIADTLNAALGQMTAVFDAQHAAMERTQADALNLVRALTAKVFPLLAESSGTGEIEAMTAALLDRLRSEPRVALMVNDEISDDLRDRLSAATASNGFSGRIDVTGDAALPKGDCRIEWSSGGAERRMSSLLAEIDDIIAANLDAAQTAAPSQPITATDAVEGSAEPLASGHDSPEHAESL